MKKRMISFLSAVLLTVFTLAAQIEVGSVIYGLDGTTPAGIVFKYDAATGIGYMVSLVDIQLPWGTTGINITGSADNINSAVASLELSGKANTSAQASQLGTRTEYAARWCKELNAGGFTDWYLPTCGELNILIANKTPVNAALRKINSPGLVNNWHWSSSEGNADLSWSVNVSSGDIYPDDKNVKKQVRAIRAFK
jgi:hypothetical protein